MIRKLAVLLLALLVLPAVADDSPFKPVAMPGWRLCLESWTFNKKTVLETIDLACKLGIQYLEVYPGQKVDAAGPEGFSPTMSDAAKALVKAKLDQTGCRIVWSGVTGVPGDEAGARRYLAACRAMGLEGLSVEPNEKQLPLLDKLTAEYGIKLAIHNHPKPSHYWDPQILLAAVKDCGPQIGACGDTGHWCRSSIDPVAALRQLKGRVVHLHFKDLNKVNTTAAHDMPWGTGASNARGMLEELKAQGYQGLFSIEYEHNTPELVDNVAKCVAWFHQTCAELAAK